jgi:hypothetical protein
VSATLHRPQPLLIFDRSRCCREVGHGNQDMVKLGGMPMRSHDR